MRTLYRGGRVFDGERMVDGHAVLVEEGRINRMAPSGEFEGFAGVTVECAGATVMPVLIDCHVHILFRGEPDPMSSLDKLDAAHAVLRAARKRHAHPPGRNDVDPGLRGARVPGVRGAERLQ